jgi:hypothetical protein
MSIRRNEASKKPVVFISHLSEEVEAALVVKSLLKDHLKESAEIFVSAVSIRPGDPWLESLFQNLESAVAEIILCSPAASERNWIHFEAGAGWMRKIPVMPLCFAGLTLRNLPDTLKHLHAVDASNRSGVEGLVNRVAREAGVSVPIIDCNGFLASIQEINARSSIGPAFPRFFETSADVQAELPDLIRNATRSILLCGIHFNISLANRISDYVAAMAAGVSLSFICIRAESSAVEQLAEFSGEEVEVLRGECQMTYIYYEKLKRAHAKQKENGGEKPGKLNLRFARKPPASRSYVFDHTGFGGKLIYVPYLQLRDSTQCPAVLMQSNHSVYPAFLQSSLIQMETSELFYQSD